MKILHQLDTETWKNFVDHHPQGNIFHTPEMFEVFSRTKGYEPSLWAAVEGTDRVLALLLPVRIFQNARLPRSMSRSIVYGGVLCESSSSGKQGLAALMEQYKKETRGRNLYTELRNLTDTAEIQTVLCSQQFAYEEHLNYLIDLDCDPEKVMARISKRTRKHIRKGLRQGKVDVEIVEDLDRVIDCYNLIKITYQNASIPIADQSLFNAAYDVLVPKGMVKFLLATVDDVPAATSVELLYKDMIYGWYSGMDRMFTSFVPNELLMWHILNWGAENDYSLYDFGGAGKPDEDYGVRDFKAKFGGTLVNFGRNKYIPFPFFYKVAEAGYKIVRQVLFS